MKRALALLLTLGGCASAPDSEPIPAPPAIDCRLHHDAATVDTLTALPANIRAALLQQAGPMADRGAFFNITDAVVQPAPFSRFIRAGKVGQWWFVWYEHGGIVYWREAVLLSGDPLSGEIAVHMDEKATDADLCTVTDRLLDGASQGAAE